MKANSKIISSFLNSFFNIFDAKIDQLNIIAEKVYGVLVWENEEEKQEFLWNDPGDNFNFENTMELVDYLIKNNLLSGDKINVTKDDLIIKLTQEGWDAHIINDSLNFLLSVKISMVDYGEITDHFFVHF
jgi:hypothetical protein